MFDLFADMPLLVLFLKFMTASTLLIGAVWLMEKLGLLKSPDLAELAWKLAIAGSFVALLPIGDWISKPITIEHTPTAELVRQFDEGRPLAQDQTATTSREPVALSPREIPNTPTIAAENATTDPQSAGLSVQRTDTGPVTDSETDLLLANEKSGALWQDLTALRTKDLALILWGCLASVAALFLIVAYWGAIRSLGSRKRVGAEHEANQTLRAICESADIRHVPYLSRSSDIKSPVCLPRKEICLPDWAFDDLPQEELNSLLAHEVAHMVRKDPLMLMFLQTMSRLFFFQPLFMLARKRLTDIAELSADEWAATRYANAHSVAAALYTCATKIHENRQIQWGLAMAGNKSMLKLRVERLIGSDTAPFKKAGIGAKTAVTASLLTITLGLPSIQFADAMYAEMPLEAMTLAAAHPHEAPSEEAIEADVRRAINEAREKVQERARRMAREAQKAYPNARPGDLPTEEEIAAEIRQVIAEAEAEVAETARMAAQEAQMALAEAEAALAEAGDHSRHHITRMDGSGNMIWHDDDRRIQANWDGEFTLTDDDRSIKSIENGGSLVITTKIDGEKRKLRVESNGDKLDFTYWEGRQKADFDKDAQAWLADTLLLMAREMGLNAEARVARFLKKGGVKAVLKEMKEIESDFVTRIYVSHLVDQADLSSGQLEDIVDRIADFDSDFEMRLALTNLLEEKKLDKKVLTKVLKAADSIDSDFEMRLLLTAYIERFGIDDKATGMLLDLAKKMDSDFELRLLLSSALSDAKIGEKNLEKFTRIAMENIGSDFELRLLLASVAHNYGSSKSATKLALEAIGHIDSDYEKRLALTTLVGQGAFDKKNWHIALEVAAGIDSDYEKRLALSTIKGHLPSDKDLQEAYNEAVASIDSDYERERVAATEHDSGMTHVRPFKRVTAMARVAPFVRVSPDSPEGGQKVAMAAPAGVERRVLPLTHVEPRVRVAPGLPNQEVIVEEE